MILRKFAELLSEKHDWSILFDNKKYTKNNIKLIAQLNINKWKYLINDLTKYSYVVCVGSNSLHYFIYTIIASLLGIKIIFCTRAQLNNALNEYNLGSYIVIDTLKNFTNSSYNLFLDLNEKTLNFDDTVNDCFEENLNQQAKIIFFTSGTTSQPKLVMYKEDSLYRNAEIVSRYLEANSADICLCVFPTNYMYGFSMLMSTLIGNGTVILERSTISSGQIIDYLKYKQVTLLPILRNIVETIAPKLIHEKCFFEKLRVLNAADKIYQHHVEMILKFSPIFWNNMGQTESGPRLFSIRFDKEIPSIPDLTFNKIIALGKPVHDEIKIEIRNQNELCQPNEVGELFYKSAFSMEGYLDKNGLLLPKAEWLTSGDLVYQNSKGIIFIVGRKSQTIKVNGVFINIDSMNMYFNSLSQIEKSYFIYDELKNKIYGYFCINSDVDGHTLRTIIQNKFRERFQNLPRLSKIFIMNDFPKTNTGKIHIRLLKQYAWNNDI